MLAHAKMRELSLDNYLEPVHPVQQTIRQTVAGMCGVHRDDMIFGIDGCTAPVYAMPLSSFAWAAAKLVDPKNLSENTRRSCEKITHAMTTYPMMVAGPGQVDTVLMQVMEGKIVAKGGAEGFQMIGIKPGIVSPKSKGIGICFKIADGDLTRRATHLLVVELMKVFGFGEQVESEAFKSFNQPILRNFRGIEVGTMRLARQIQLFE